MITSSNLFLINIDSGFMSVYLRCKLREGM